MRAIAVTFEHDHSDYSKVWLDYYSQFLDTQVIKIGDILKEDWGATTKFLNSTQEGLFKCYDLILYADVDEIVVANPDKYKDLGEYLKEVKGDVVRCVGYNIMEMEGDKPLDLTKPILKQRSYWQRDKLYDKFVIITKPQVYLNNHHIKNEVPSDPDLIMLHLRDADIKGAKERNSKLGVVFNDNDLSHRRQQATKIPDNFINLI